jgi:fructose-1,6-bisphosphatase/inositol monophosphatase family enzyme
MNKIENYKKIQKTFEEIPKEKILNIAKEIKQRIIDNPSLVQLKDKKEYVTKADFEIQNFILDFFSKSELSGKYKIKAEEELSDEQRKSNLSKKDFQLIIDPLDGTSEFCNNNDTWGTMIGLCDKEGRLIYSWNLLSNGDIYSSDTKSETFLSFKEKINQNKKIAIDVYDYNESASKKFSKAFKKISGLKKYNYIQTSYPAAIWTGYKLFNQDLDGLLWIPSNSGKKFYPDYDLIFLGALQKKGYKIKLGKIEKNIALVAVAPTKKDIETLWNIGLEIISESEKKNIVCVINNLKITSKTK